MLPTVVVLQGKVLLQVLLLSLQVLLLSLQVLLKPSSHMYAILSACDVAIQYAHSQAARRQALTIPPLDRRLLTSQPGSLYIVNSCCMSFTPWLSTTAWNCMAVSLSQYFFYSSLRSHAENKYFFDSCIR
jgi:hypothetical protein